MIKALWNNVFYDPLYNGFIFLADIIPSADLGIVIILFTILIKLALFPFSIKAVKTQRAVKLVEPELKAIKEKYKDDKQTQATKTMALYKEKNIKPFSGFLLLLIQMPIIFAMYFIFLRGGLPEINLDILYSFVPSPGTINTMFLGFIDVTGKSVVLALLTGASQFIHTSLSMSKSKKSDKKFGEGSMKEDFARSMKLQMKYVLPVFVTFIAYTLSSAIALYWTTSNIFHILQELYVKKKFKEPEDGDVSKKQKTAIQSA